MAKQRHKIVPAAYLTLIRDNKILLLRRCNTSYQDGNYSIVAGHVDEGESFTQSIIRETAEEAGITIEPEDLKVAHVMQRIQNASENNERIDIFFITEKWAGEITNKEPEKCDDLSWFDLDNLPENIIPYVQQAINCIKDNIFYSEHGWDK